jgi:hypothetical protein
MFKAGVTATPICIGGVAAVECSITALLATLLLTALLRPTVLYAFSLRVVACCVLRTIIAFSIIVLCVIIYSIKQVPCAGMRSYIRITLQETQGRDIYTTAYPNPADIVDDVLESDTNGAGMRAVSR